MLNDREIAEGLRRRLGWASWLRAAMVQHPGGILPARQACKVLGIDASRLKQLIRAGRLPTLTPPEWLSPADVWIPVDALFGAPCELDRGRPLVKSRVDGLLRRAEADHSQSYPTPRSAQNQQQSAQNRKNLYRPGEDRKPARDNGLRAVWSNVP